MICNIYPLTKRSEEFNAKNKLDCTYKDKDLRSALSGLSIKG